MAPATTRAALVTGASSGIGLAIARMLVEEGHAVTMVARRPGKLAETVAGLAGEGAEVTAVPGNLAEEAAVKAAVAAHRDRYGRLDVLVNNAGIGVGAMLDQLSTKHVDLQLNVNLRATVLCYREAVPLLRAAGAEHRNALVVNTASVSAKQPQPWMSVYSATKAAVVAFTQAMNRELAAEGIKSCALCPGFVDTPMTEFVRGQVAQADMIRPEDVAELVRALLRLSPACVVPELVMIRPGDVM